MTIVTEDKVSDALAYLSDSPHPLAVARKRVTDAENKAKRTYAAAFIAADGSVEARKATAETNEKYAEAKKQEGDAILDLEDHKARMKAAEMLIEIWRTENANIRAAERIR